MAVMVVDHSEAEIGLGVRDRPEAIVGRGTVDKPTDRPLGLDPSGVDRGVPEPHRFRVGEALVHRVHIFVPELAQTEARGCEGRVRRGELDHLAIRIWNAFDHASPDTAGRRANRSERCWGMLRRGSIRPLSAERIEKPLP
jgi:hypothetical protein